MENTKIPFCQVSASLKRTDITGKLSRLGYFLFIYSLVFLLSNRTDIVSNDPDSPVNRIIGLLLTKSSVMIFKLFYPDIHADKDFIISVHGRQYIQLLPVCNGLIHLIRIIIPLLLYPIKWRYKMILLPVTTVMMFFATLLHFMILTIIIFHAPGWYDFSHLYIAPAIFFGLNFLCWIIWEKFVEFQSIRRIFNRKSGTPESKK